MILRALLVWLVLMVLAIANGAVRTFLISPYTTDTAARILSTLLLCAIIFLLAWSTISWIAPKTRNDAVVVGFLWLGMTLAFELLAGHYLFGASWAQLLEDYNLAAGRIWVLVPITCALAPILAFRQPNPSL